MTYKDQMCYWANLSQKQKDKLTILINNTATMFSSESSREHCGGGTINDYYRIEMESFVFNMLEVLNEK